VRAVVQRVAEARVAVDDEVVGAVTLLLDTAENA
jgi:D-Tyr-tRNAtyr deacylase